MYPRVSRGPIKSSKSAEELSLDVYFQKLGLWRKIIPKDGCCLFRIASEILVGTQVGYDMIRRMYQKHASIIKVDDQECLFSFLSTTIKMDFEIFWSCNFTAQPFTHNNHPKTLTLCTTDNQHFDLVLPLNKVTNAAFCQSLLYELLYDKVLEVEDSVLKAKEMMRKESVVFTPGHVTTTTPLIGIFPSQQQHDNNNFTFPSFQQQQDNFEIVQTRASFPYKVAKSLSLDILRNVEYDAWVDAKKDTKTHEQPDSSVLPGDKCQVVLHKHAHQTFNAHIQEVKPNEGRVVVFVEGLGERHIVDKDSVKMVSRMPLPDWRRKSKKKSIETQQLHHMKETRLTHVHTENPSYHGSGMPSVFEGEGLVGGEYGDVFESNESVFYDTPPEAHPFMREGSVGREASGDGVMMMRCPQQTLPASPTNTPCSSSHFMLVPCPDAHLLHPINQPTNQPINYQAPLSTQANATDLPDLFTNRYFYNLGKMTYKGWGLYQEQQQQQQQQAIDCTHNYTPSPPTTPITPCHHYHPSPCLADQIFVPSSEYVLLTSPSPANGAGYMATQNTAYFFPTAATSYDVMPM